MTLIRPPSDARILTWLAPEKAHLARQLTPSLVEIVRLKSRAFLGFKSPANTKSARGLLDEIEALTGRLDASAEVQTALVRRWKNYARHDRTLKFEEGSGGEVEDSFTIGTERRLRQFVFAESGRDGSPIDTSNGLIWVVRDFLFIRGYLQEQVIEAGTRSFAAAWQVAELVGVDSDLLDPLLEEAALGCTISHTDGDIAITAETTPQSKRLAAFALRISTNDESTVPSIHKHLTGGVTSCHGRMSGFVDDGCIDIVATVSILPLSNKRGRQPLTRGFDILVQEAGALPPAIVSQEVERQQLLTTISRPARGTSLIRLMPAKQDGKFALNPFNMYTDSIVLRGTGTRLAKGAHIEQQNSITTDRSIIDIAVRRYSAIDFLRNGPPDFDTFGAIKARLDAGDDPHERHPRSGMTLMHMAAYSGDASMIDLLLAKPDIDWLIRDVNGKFPSCHVRWASLPPEEQNEALALSDRVQDREMQQAHERGLYETYAMDMHPDRDNIFPVFSPAR